MPAQLKTKFAHIAAVVLSACTLLAACSDTTIGTRSFEESETLTIPGGPINLSVAPVEIPWDIDLASQPAYSEGDFDYVTSVKVRDIFFEITPESNLAANDQFEDGNLDSFEFVSSLGLSLKATLDGVEQTVEIANLPMNDPQIASNASTLTMNVNDVDIRDMIEAPGGATALITIAGNVPPDFVIVKATIRFRVGVGFR